MIYVQTNLVVRMIFGVSTSRSSKNFPTFDSGETEWNREGKLQGQTDIELNQTGRDQASKASQRLKDESFDKVANIYFLTSHIRLTVTVFTVDIHLRKHFFLIF